MSASASDVPRAIVFATVADDRREARDHDGLLGRHGADLVQSGDQRDRGDRSDAGNRGENIKAPGEDGITGDQALDRDIEVGDRYLDGLELAFELQDQPRDLARAEAVENGGPRGDGGIAAMHEFLQGLDEAGRRRGDAGAEALAQDREHPRVDGIGLGQGANGLGKQTRTQRIDESDRKTPSAEIAVSLAVKLA